MSDCEASSGIHEAEPNTPSIGQTASYRSGSTRDAKATAKG